MESETFNKDGETDFDMENSAYKNIINHPLSTNNIEDLVSPMFKITKENIENTDNTFENVSPH